MGATPRFNRLMVAAFDLGAHTGVAIGLAGQKPALSTEMVGSRSIPHGARFLAMQRLTLQIINLHRPDRIVIEKPIAAGVKGSEERVQLAMGYRAAVMTAAYAKSVPFFEFSVMSVRRHFIGSSKLHRAKAKAATVARASALGWKPMTEDEGDAAAVWDYACSKMAPHLHSAVPYGGLFDRSS